MHVADDFTLCLPQNRYNNAGMFIDPDGTKLYNPTKPCVDNCHIAETQSVLGKRVEGMLTTRRFKKQFGGNVCRHCVNDLMGVHLIPKECKYVPGRSTCPRCLKNAHIVKGFKLKGKWKLRRK